MATNPLYHTNDSPNNATQPSKSVNQQNVYVPRSHNTFDNSYFNFTTERFGSYEPFFVMEGVPRDIIPLHSSHNVRALPMRSPFMGQIDLHKDYFLVPNNAIQPKTFDYIYTQPVQGDDVPEDAHNVFPILHPSGGPIFGKLLVDAFDSGLESTDRFINQMICEFFFSAGSLLYKLGYKMNPIFYFGDEQVPRSFDAAFDYACSLIESLEFEVNGKLYSYFSDGTGNVTLHQALSLFRRFGSKCENLDCVWSNAPAVRIDLTSLPTTDDRNNTINMDRVIAYQLACSQFYVNPKVDFIYNAQLYRDNLFTLSNRIYDVGMLSFTYNGIVVPYDYCSRRYYAGVISAWFSPDFGANTSDYLKLYDYFNALFGYRETLRFGDYFTDCRTRPLAIGDDMVTVNEDGVSVIDMSQSIVLQRYRNACVKIGQDYSDYLREILGSDPSPDYHVPKFIAHQEFNISGFEVANTSAENQGDLVTNLSTRDDTFAFEISVDMPCIIIGISSFTCPRCYMQTKERFFFHQDRYDMFNPMLQYLGDQAVYNKERTDLRPENEVFGYQSRHNEYKQRYSQASGAFPTYLPSWAFITDSIFDPITDIAIANTQGVDFIRAHDYEFNRFFSDLKGYSVAGAFHFIVVYNNKCMSTRPMEVNPNIL